jgi:hypothetical protein
MNIVLLLCTVHYECGRANAAELLTILTHICPDVIFLEVPASAFCDYYETGNRENLESNAVRQYRAMRPVQLVPVDYPTPEREFFENHEQFHMRVRDLSPDYRRLQSWDSCSVREYGFAYLNSENCCQSWSEIYCVIHRDAKKIEDPMLIAAGETWERLIELRETTMIENIHNYCTANNFHRGVFLVGAAHRQGIIMRSAQFAKLASINVHWEYAPSWPQ